MIKVLLATALSLLALDLLLPNVSISSPLILVVTTLVLTLINLVIKPVLGVLLLPLSIITLGVFGGILNIFLLWLVTAVVPGFHIDPVIIAGFHLGYFTTLVVVGFLIALGQRLLLTILDWF